MKKNILSILFVFIGTGFCSAQKQNTYLKMQGAIEMPLGSFARNFKSGNGLYVTGYRSISKKGSLLAGLGYAYWNKKDTLPKSPKAEMIPIQLGFNYTIYSNFYVEARSGLTILTGAIAKGTGINLDIGAGYLVKISEGFNIDLSAKFSYLNDLNRSSYSWIGIGAGWKIKFKKKS
ncbi:hypothetical protein [Ferruginibacter sp.]